MNSTYNVVALNVTPTALARTAPGKATIGPVVRTTAAFRNLIEAPASGAELALLRIVLTDVQNGGMWGYVTWSIDEVCETLVIRQWPSCRLLDIVPFPVGKLSPETRASRFVAPMNSKTATLGIVDDPDPSLKDENGRAIGTRVIPFP